MDARVENILFSGETMAPSPIVIDGEIEIEINETYQLQRLEITGAALRISNPNSNIKPSSFALLSIKDNDSTDTESTCSFHTTQSNFEEERLGLETTPNFEAETIIDPRSPATQEYSFSDAETESGSAYEPLVIYPKQKLDPKSFQVTIISENNNENKLEPTSPVSLAHSSSDTEIQSLATSLYSPKSDPKSEQQIRQSRTISQIDTETETLVGLDSPTSHIYTFSDTESESESENIYDPIFSPKSTRDATWGFVYGTSPPPTFTPRPIITPDSISHNFELFPKRELDTSLLLNSKKTPKLPDLTACLQCHLLGLRCSLSATLKYKNLLARTKTDCCTRCARNGEEFCIRCAEVKWGGEYKAENCFVEAMTDGKTDERVKEKAKEMIQQKKAKDRFALPWVMSGVRRKAMLKVWRDGSGYHDEVVDRV